MITGFVKKYQAWIALIGAFFSFGVAVPLLHLSQQSADISDSPYLRTDPEKIVLADNDDRVPCGECHTLEYDVWKTTEHSTGFDTMHRSAQAQSILERMDFRLSKRESLCLRCHYTAQIKNDQARAIAGVSCESCHGAGRDWVNIHNDYGGSTHETESEAHKQQRVQASVQGGMLRPSDNVYAVAANCFECHTVPSEELINVGRHPSGSNFELVEWSDNVRHNFLEAQWSSNETNREQSPQRKRQLYVIGRLLDYEYSLRGAAEATEAGKFSKAMERRVASAVRELEKIARVIEITEINSVLQLHRGVSLVPNNKAALTQVADQIRGLGQQLGAVSPPNSWEPLDLLVAGGSPALPEPPPEESTVDAAPAATNPTSSATPTTGTPTETPAAPVSASVSGEKRQRPAWFQAEQYEVTVPGCNCHAMAEDWLFDDAHSRSSSALQNQSRRALEIASLYGLSASQMNAGNQICMQCHGTVESGTGGGPVFESVGCESCHGPSSGYLQPHKRGQGFQNGLKDLKNADIRAANCARCHHISDERLLASGHPSGNGYNIGTGNNAIKHWPDPDLDRPPGPELAASALAASFETIKRQRPIPQVTVASPPPVATRTAPAPRRASSSTVSSRVDAGTSSQAPVPPRIRPAAPVPTRSPSRAVTIPPAPALSDSASVEEILLHVKNRLEQLYQALGRNE